MSPCRSIAPFSANPLKLLRKRADARLTEGTAADRAALARFKVTGERVKLVRDKDAAVRALGAAPVSPAQAVTQRQLDVQEGRVLVLIDILLKALRAARRVHTTLVLPRARARHHRRGRRTGS